MENNPGRPGLDDFTRRYLLVLGALALGGLFFWLASLDSRVGELNSILDSDPSLASYPYQFRVRSLENGVARVSSPRSAQVSVIQALRIVDSTLVNVSATDPRMMTAQEELATKQSHAAKLLLAQDGVHSIRWAIDRQWYSDHGVYID